MFWILVKDIYLIYIYGFNTLYDGIHASAGLAETGETEQV